MYFWGHKAVADDRDRPRSDSMSHTTQSRWRTFVPGVTSEFTKTLQPLCPDRQIWMMLFYKTGQAALSKTHSDHRCSKASFQSGALQSVLRKYCVLNSRSEMIAFCHRGICLFSSSFFPFFFFFLNVLTSVSCLIQLTEHHLQCWSSIIENIQWAWPGVYLLCQVLQWQ